ncbi:response regulator transcription factor [Paenibacillus flagellatus]|uniref:DNA-binding response regulator n=1 Tax=Paenibacillus flagellatus TaxID=2211139 RepID=A0A2V5K7U4_9BACL|nr:helix-turn-helix domain-containing protein [Paenibacillus flagellatus]PYI55539.1 hypothetical protein DLM86_07345 [Paenibacillus flagellatus]
MWSLLIVEDEEEVRSFLRKHVDWERCGFRVIGEAGNGRAAWELIRKHRPDAVLCDIFMPIMDGLQLLERCRESGSPALFVMLTCANEFAYAQQALKLGAFNYMLKLSMGVEEMQDELIAVGKELAKRKKAESERLYLNWLPAYKQAWDDIRRPNPDDCAVGKLAQQAAEEGYAHVGIVSFIDVREEEVDEPRLDTAGLFALRSSVLTHAFRASGVTTSFIWSKAPEPLVPPAEAGENDSYLAVYGTARTVDWGMLWRQAIDTLTSGWYEARTGWVPIRAGSAGRSKSLSDAEAAVWSWKQEAELIHALEEGRWDACEELILKTGKTMERMKVSFLTDRDVAERVEQIVSRVRGLDGSKKRTNASRAIHHERLWEGVMACFVEHLPVSFPFVRPITDHAEVNAMLDYIDMHFKETITLHALSRHVSMEESYISALFKKKTGMNVVGYVNRYRIHRSMQLLKETGLSVQTIGQSVGFASEHYFNRLFKKLVGLSPGEFRKRNRG